MARTAVTVTELTPNAATADPTPTTADATNGHVIGSVTGGTVPLEQLVLRVANTSGSTKTVTLKAGANPPAAEAILGDVTFSVPATTGVKWVGPIQSGRHAQDDGTVRVDLEAGFVGTITAFRMPRTA